MNLNKYTSDIPEIKNHLKEILYLKKEIKKHQRRLKTTTKKYDFINKIVGVGINGVILEKSIFSLFKDLGFEKVKHIGNDKKLADVEITVKDKIILIEAKGISPDIPTENDCSQISKYIKRKSSKFTDNRIFGVFIVNHDNKKFFNLRNPNPFDQTRIEDAKISDYGLMTTYDLFKYYLEIKKHTISLNEFENIICKKGLIKYKKMARKTPITT